MNCRFCGKSFNRGFNLRRHESEYCPLQDHNSSIESGSDQSTGISTKRKYADTDDSTSESDSEHSDYTDEDQENEYETDPWASLKMEAMTKNMPEFQELTETFTADGLEEEEARDKSLFIRNFLLSTAAPKASSGSKLSSFAKASFVFIICL